MKMDNKSFKEETFGAKVFIIITMSILVVGAISFVIAIYYFGIVGLFNILGVHYDSLSSLFWFVASYFLLGIIGDIFIKIMNTLMKKSYKWNQLQLNIGFLIFSFFVNLAIVSFLNYVMHSIDLEIWAQFILALIAALIDVIFDSEKKSK